jgi:hypothetical protein
LQVPIKIVNEETKLFRLELRKAKIEGLNGFVITENNKPVFAVQIQLVELCASLSWPKNRLSIVNLKAQRAGAVD